MVAYWTEHLKDLPDVLDLPADFPRQKCFDYKGAAVEHIVSETIAEKIKAFCGAHGYSEYVVFLAAYGLLLSAVSGHDDMMIGTPVAGRTRLEYEKICGPFINTLPVRLTIRQQDTVKEMLTAVQKEVADMLDHQNIGLEEIISAIGLERGSQNALYKVMMTQSPVDINSFMLDDGKLQFCPIPTDVAKMDLVMELSKTDSGYLLRFTYATSLFEEETIRFYGRCIAHTAEQLVSGSDRSVSALSLMTAADRETYLEAPNLITTPFLNCPIHVMLKNRALQFPEETAVIFHGERMTYGALERRA